MKLYTAGRVLVGDGRVLSPGGVAVSGSTIVDVRPVAAEQVEHPDCTLLPGLIDAHVHLGFDGGPDPVGRLRRESDTQLLLTMVRSGTELVRAGVTTARDLGARGFLDLDLRTAIDAGIVPGPRLLLATRPLTPPQGHCWYLGGECAGEGDLRKAVRRQHEAGADWIKIMVTGGNTTSGSRAWQAQFSPAEVAAAVGEAHALGLPVAAHAHGTDGIRLAAECGVDTLEHCTWQTERGFDGYLPEIADIIAAAGIPVCATFNPQLATRPEFAEPRRRVVADMRARGVRFIAGTDAGVVGTPHGGYAEGLRAMAGYGFAPAEVLRAATLDAATALGLGGRTGSLVAGKDADFVLVTGDPLVDLGALARPRLVVVRGREIR